jgi:hypothetical protein
MNTERRTFIVKLLAYGLGTALLLISISLIVSHAASRVGTNDAPPSTTVTNSKHGKTGDNGSGQKSVVNVPSAWPAEVPLPSGTVTGSSGLALAMVVDGPYSQVTETIQDLYHTHGFSSRTQSPLQFENTNYTVTIAIENRDHSAVSNNVTIVVFQKVK